MRYNRIQKLGKEKLQEYANESTSIAQLLEKLGYSKIAGGSYGTVKKYLQEYNIKTDHWTGQGWSKNKQLKDWSQYSKHQNFRKHLLEEKGNVCELCCLSLWQNNPIPLEVHHVDGDRTNNLFENLKLLCPNCHALTDTWKGRNK